MGQDCCYVTSTYMIKQLAKEASDSHEAAEEVIYVYFNKEQLWVLSIIIYD